MRVLIETPIGFLERRLGFNEKATPKTIRLYFRHLFQEGGLMDQNTDKIAVGDEDVSKLRKQIINAQKPSR